MDKTSGLLLSEFDPFDSLGTEHRFMAELSLLGEFRFVEGPIYFKSWHGENLSIKRLGWSREHWITAVACFAAWMIEVITPAGASVQERRRLFKITLERFAGPRGFGNISSEERAGLLRQVFERLKSGGRFDPRECMNTTWEALESRYSGTTE
jgi:hypothetical protein